MYLRSSSHALAFALGLGAAASGCGGDDAGVPVEVVPVDVPRVSATTTCVPVAPGSRVVGVSSEGELWLVEGGSNQTRVIDATGASHTGVGPVDDAAAVLPWTADSSTLIVDGELWTVTRDDREFLATPVELGRIGQLCGDPAVERGAFVGTDKGLFERLGGFWWRWTPATAASFGTARQLVRNDGSCVGKDDVVWLVNTAGELWRIAPDDARVVAGGADDDKVTAAAAAGAEGAAALAGERLRIGPPWHDVQFTAGPSTAIAGGGGALWVQVGADVYQRQGGAWRVIIGAAPGATAMYPHAAAGAWFSYPDQVCHAALGAPVVIHGLRPYEHRVAAVANLTVSSAEAELTVERDGVAVATLPGSGEHTLMGFDLGPPGWHQLTVRAAAASRVLDYNVVDLPLRSWATDVQPIFAASCGGAPCHGPSPAGTQVDLSSYQSWRSRAGRIRERLLLGQMPPVPPRLEPDTVAIVLEWIEGGMKP